MVDKKTSAIFGWRLIYEARVARLATVVTCPRAFDLDLVADATSSITSYTTALIYRELVHNPRRVRS